MIDYGKIFLIACLKGGDVDLGKKLEPSMFSNTDVRECDAYLSYYQFENRCIDIIRQLLKFRSPLHYLEVAKNKHLIEPFIYALKQSVPIHVLPFENYLELIIHFKEINHVSDLIKNVDAHTDAFKKLTYKEYDELIEQFQEAPFIAQLLDDIKQNHTLFSTISLLSCNGKKRIL